MQRMGRTRRFLFGRSAMETLMQLESRGSQRKKRLDAFPAIRLLPANCLQWVPGQLSHLVIMLKAY